MAVFIELLLIGVGLSMDAFAVSICKGLAMRRVNKKQAFVIGLFFGGFQALMPFIGWALGTQFESYITSIDHWIAFVLLAFIGGKMIAEATGLQVQRFLAGIQGGDQQIASRIACNEVDLLLFFRDPINAKPSEPNEMTLLRLCDVHNIPLATNIATAEVLIHGLERGDLDWRDIVHPQNS